MIYNETTLKDAYVLDVQRFEDERGYFARVMCSDEFAERGLVSKFVQTNHSYNSKRGTLRGMHFQPRTGASSTSLKASATASSRLPTIRT